ncbi:MAG TPA: hypothetical protein PK938_00825 [Bacteroidaceae bacterium]|nr:hypothetical protein [Bacteroidaceae bacterium]
MKKFAILIIFLTASLMMSGQNRQTSPIRQPNNTMQGNIWWQQRFGRGQSNQPLPNRSGVFSPAEYSRQQKEFFIKNAGLTQEEADVFFPIYNELQQKKRELNREIRRLSRQDGQSEQQCLNAIDTIADVKIRIAELEKTYLERFKKVLPASKILKVQNAEEQFNSQILKDIQQSRQHSFGQNLQRFNQPSFTPQPPGRPNQNPNQNNNR